MGRDARLVNHKDYSNPSRYANQYTLDKEFYDGAKPFVHLKLDEACIRTKPEGGDYEIYFTPEGLTVRLTSKTDDNLKDWQVKASELLNSLTIKEFRPSKAHPEDKKVFDMLNTLADKLKGAPIEHGDITATAEFH